MPCEGCNRKFTLLKRRKACDNCAHDFCDHCLTRNNLEKTSKCRRCIVFASLPFDRNAVTQLRVKDLQWFLQGKSIPFIGCKEKTELIDLIMDYSHFQMGQSTYPQNNNRHTVIPELINHTNEVLISDEAEEELISDEAGPSGGHSTSDELPESELSVLDETHSSDSPNTSQHFSNNPRYLTLDDIKSMDEISQLTVMQLKVLLTKNFVTYRGCCEKSELQEKARWLWRQKEAAKNIDAEPDENLCKICMTAVVNSVFLDCGHMMTCLECGKVLHECPVCRQIIIRVVHVFKV